MSDTEGENIEPSTEVRLNAVEEKVTKVKRELVQLYWLLGGAVAAAVVVILFVGHWKPPEPEPSNHDGTVEDLLSEGVHCYDSAPERAAARQRALAAIDRITWERDHPEPAEYPLGSPGPLPTKVASVVDTVPQGESWDAKRCFQITYTGYY